MKKFEKSDVFFNVIRANPKSSFFIYDGKVYHANSTEQSIQLNTFLPAPPVQLDGFDFVEGFSFEESWPGTFSEASYTWSPAVLASPEVAEIFEYSESWPGTFSEVSYTWSPAVLASPDISDGFEIAEGW